MNKTDILTLFEYNTWANQRILETTAEIEPNQFTAKIQIGFGSLRKTLVHTLVAEFIWRQRWEGTYPVEVFEAEEFPDFDALRGRWTVEENAMTQFITNIREEKLAHVIEYKTSRGEVYQNILWQLMLHLINHGTQHRSEAAAMLTEFGHSPGELDFLGFLRETQ